MRVFRDGGYLVSVGQTDFQAMHRFRYTGPRSLRRLLLLAVAERQRSAILHARRRPRVTIRRYEPRMESVHR